MKTFNKIIAFFMALFFVSGVALAENKSATAGQYIEDSAITTSVKAKFMGEKNLKASDISVETNNGMVKLSGEVDNTSQMRRAEQITKQVEGVKGVNNDLKVK